MLWQTPWPIRDSQTTFHFASRDFSTVKLSTLQLSWPLLDQFNLGNRNIFAMYLHYQVSEKGADKKTSIVFYSILILYILSTAIIATDVAQITGEVYLSYNSAGTNNNLFIRGSDTPVSLHMDQYVSADSEHQHSGFDWGYHGRLCRLYLSKYPSKHKPVNHGPSW